MTDGVCRLLVHRQEQKFGHGSNQMIRESTTSVCIQHLDDKFWFLFSVASRWTSFAHELGGLLCASLNFVASNVSSSSPYYSFRPQSTLPKSNGANLDNSLLRYAALPREIVCTGWCFSIEHRRDSDWTCSL